MSLRFLSVILFYFRLPIFILLFSYLLFSYRTLLITVLFNRTDRLSCINIRVIITIITIFYHVQAGVGGGRGGGFGAWIRFKRLDFENAQNSKGVEILRHRTGLSLCKSCQTILGLKQIHVSFKRRQKNTLWRGSLSVTKCHRYKARPRNLSTISPTRNVTYMYTHTPESVFPENIFIIKSG